MYNFLFFFSTTISELGFQTSGHLVERVCLKRIKLCMLEEISKAQSYSSKDSNSKNSNNHFHLFYSNVLEDLVLYGVLKQKN